MYTARLVNSPAQDPALLTELAGQPGSYLFDCGTLHNLATRDLLRVRRVFVTHTHIDHFCGFDHLVRMQLFSTQPLEVYGPKGTADRVGAKLAGYSWNLVSSSQYRVRVHELGLTSTEFVCSNGFKPEAAGKELEPTGGGLALEEGPALSWAAVEHGVPCLAYALRWPGRRAIDPQALRELGIPPGPWLEEVKRRTEGELKAGERSWPVAELRSRLVRERPGASLAYLTDTVCSKAVMKTAIKLAEGVDELWCEAAYLHEHGDKARENLHMTARQAARLAKEAGVRRLYLFHQSRRYSGALAAHLEEARAVFPETHRPPLYKAAGSAEEHEVEQSHRR